jgi:hypothetical protein
MEPVSRTEQGWGEMVSHLSGGSCIEAPQMLALVERGPRAKGYERLMSHVAACPSCRKLLKELRAVEAARPKRRFQLLGFPAIFPISVGVAAAALLYFALASFFGPGSSALPSPRSYVERDTPPQPKSPATTREESRMAQRSEPKQPAIVPRKPRISATRKPKSEAPKRGGTLKRSKIVEPPERPPRFERTLDASAEPVWSSSGQIRGEVLTANVLGGEVMPSNSVQGTVGGPIPERRKSR